MGCCSWCSSARRNCGLLTQTLQDGMHVGHDFPSFLGAELGGVRRHFARTHRGDVKDPAWRELHEAIGDIGRRRRDFPGDRAITFALLSVADRTIGLEKRLALFLSLRCCVVRILQLTSGTGGLLFPGAIVEEMVAARYRAGHGLLQRKTVTRNSVGSEGFVSLAPRHVRHVLVGAPL